MAEEIIETPEVTAEATPEVVVTSQSKRKPRAAKVEELQNDDGVFISEATRAEMAMGASLLKKYQSE